MPHSAASDSRRPDVPTRAHSRHALPVVEPFRLDLTATALRRVPTNVVDVLTATGEYLHAFAGAHGPVIARVGQKRPDVLDVTLEGDPRDAHEHERVASLVGRTLGVDRDLTPFYESAGRLPWLAPLADRLRGIKPPRYRTLWEAFVNAVVFQQVSLHAATAVVRRMVTALGAPAGCADIPLYLFPGIDRVLSATDVDLRATGLSTAKIATLRRAGEAIGSGALTEEMIEQRSSVEAAALLRQLKGIGPWTATVILLRGFGRLDVFPGNDSGVARNLTLVARDVPLDIEEALAALGAQRGMLYFHLLLARLEMRGEVGRASIPWQ